MKVLEVRNVHTALPHALWMLEEHGIRRESRNGPVLQAPWPVTTVYERPQERVLFWRERDANPFFHLYEALWMLAGRRDIAPLVRYASKFGAYSDDGVTQHGAYGYRWRRQFGKDQLSIIVDRLRKDLEDRRCVLQMWDAILDLGQPSRDLPCNTTATFQIGPDGRLDLTVFCRSNDIVWGCYGANAVHFSFLLEYMALRIGCSMGVYRQVSVNWHGYVATLAPLASLTAMAKPFGARLPDPYRDGSVHTVPMFHGNPELLDDWISALLHMADSGYDLGMPFDVSNEPFFSAAYSLLQAHHVYRSTVAKTLTDRADRALDVLTKGDTRVDWTRAGIEWLVRRANPYKK